LIDAIVHGYGDAARRMQTAGLDGCRVVAITAICRAVFESPVSICATMRTAAISTAAALPA